MKTLLLVTFASVACFFLAAGTHAQKKHRSAKPTQNAQTPEKPQPKSKDSYGLDLESFLNDEWRNIADGKYDRFFYNPTKISRTDGGSLKFWIKETAKGGSIYWTADVASQRKREGLEADVNKYAALDHVLTLYEVDCSKHEMRLLSRIDYSDKGETLSSLTRRGEIEWDNIIPESFGETFARYVCTEEDRK